MKKELLQKISECDTGEQIAAVLKFHEWDFIIAGDGSATTWGRAGGWAGRLYVKEEKAVYDFSGGATAMTNIIAETHALLYPLLYVYTEYKGLKGKVVHLITDCQFVAKAGNYEVSRDKHLPLWSMFTVCEQYMRLRFHYIPRDTLPANVWAHDEANRVRKLLQEGD